MMNVIPMKARLAMAWVCGWLIGRWIAASVQFQVGFERGQCGQAWDDQAEISANWLIRRRLDSLETQRLCSRIDKFFKLA